MFAGYLYLQQLASQVGRLNDLRPDFLQFYKNFFEVADHPLGKPYIKIFINQKPSKYNLWLNENVTGSYAPSSLRDQNPLLKVIQAREIQAGRYTLKANHAALALKYLLFDTPVQVADLAVVLYRDFGFKKENFLIRELTSIFAYEFGYADSPQARSDKDFELLFSLKTAEHWDHPWLEPVKEMMSTPKNISPARIMRKARSMTADQLTNAETEPGPPNNQPPLKKLAITGLLSFGDKTVFEFGPLNILIGPNGSGKSNLLNCIRVLRLAPFDIQEAFKDTGFEDWLYKGSSQKSALIEAKINLSEPVQHRLRFSPHSLGGSVLEEVIAMGEDELKDPLFIGSSRGGATLSAVGKRKRINRNLKAELYNPVSSILSQIRDAGQYPEITHLATLYSQIRIYSEWTFGRTSKLREATPTGRTTANLSESMDDLALALNGLEKTNAHEAIRIYLRDLKETYVDYITRILFGRVGLELLESPFESPLPAQRLSDGTLRFLALAAILLEPKPPPIICLEEPELGMHPDMIRMVAKMIIDAAARTQLIVTTHSDQLLSALQNDFDVLFAFDTGLSGSIVRRFSQDEYATWREEHTLGELWTSGELGGNRW